MKELFWPVAVTFIALGVSCEIRQEAPLYGDELPPRAAATEVEGRPTIAPAIAPAASRSQDRVAAQVVRVIDGNTIEVEMGGRLYTVRYIGVDTPETGHPTKGAQPYGPEASERNRRLVEGRTVYLERDVSETDRSGRLLRYVYVDDAMANAVLVQEGLAQLATYPPDVKYVDDFLAFQRQAMDVGRGLWSLEGASDVEVSIGGLETNAPAGDQETVGGCDPAYPTVCIPPPPPDLNCGDIQFRGFQVLPPDPHRFDGDKDGVGCKT